MSQVSHTVLTLVRHGETSANIDGVWHGSIDTPLTRRGHEQASRVAAYAAETCCDAVALYSSPLQRARDTAGAIGELLNLEVRSDPDLAEYDLGSWELVRRGIRNTGAKNFGGPVLTAGDLIFIAATPDEKIRAFDKYTGQVLWEHKLPAAGYATPCTYMINGTQFVVIAAGGGGKLGTKHGDSIVAFALNPVLCPD